MNIATLIVTLLLAMLVAPLTVEAQPPGKVYRIGWLGAGTTPRASFLEAFLEEMPALGYVEGQHLVMEHRGTVVIHRPSTRGDPSVATGNTPVASSAGPHARGTPPCGNSPTPSSLEDQRYQFSGRWSRCRDGCGSRVATSGSESCSCQMR
jgi:hypothetical protein